MPNGKSADDANMAEAKKIVSKEKALIAQTTDTGAQAILNELLAESRKPAKDHNLDPEKIAADLAKLNLDEHLPNMLVYDPDMKSLLVSSPDAIDIAKSIGSEESAVKPWRDQFKKERKETLDARIQADAHALAKGDMQPFLDDLKLVMQLAAKTADPTTDDLPKGISAFIAFVNQSVVAKEPKYNFVLGCALQISKDATSPILEGVRICLCDKDSKKPLVDGDGKPKDEHYVPLKPDAPPKHDRRDDV